MLERYGHGGDVRTAEELYGIDAEQFVDFSANMNPYGPPPCVADILRGYSSIIGRYPDPAVRGLREKLAAHHSINYESLLVGNGAAELIDLVVRVLKPEITVILAPSFIEYGDAARKIGSKLHTIKLAPQQQFNWSMEQMRLALAELRAAGTAPGTAPGAALWFIGSPNNPTGQLLDSGIIWELLEAGERVVVDEAFMDFVLDEERYSLLSASVQTPGLMVIRSMTKFYAIPGIRLGYMSAVPELIAALRELQIPWSVNSLAQQIGEAVLDEHLYREQTLQWLAKERPWLVDQLAQLGLHVYDGSVNYILAAVPASMQLTAAELQHKLGAEGILIRDASHFEGLDSSFFRVAVRLRADNERLLAALRKVFHHEG